MLVSIHQLSGIADNSGTIPSSPAASTEQITFLEPDLQIAKVEFDDEGIYSCVAKNTFAEYLDGTPREWESRLYHELKVKG